MGGFFFAAVINSENSFLVLKISMEQLYFKIKLSERFINEANSNSKQKNNV